MVDQAIPVLQWQAGCQPAHGRAKLKNMGVFEITYDSRLEPEEFSPQTMRARVNQRLPCVPHYVQKATHRKKEPLIKS